MKKQTLLLAFAGLLSAGALQSCGDSTETTTSTTETTTAPPPADSPVATTPPADAAPAPATMTDQEFVTKASAANIAEVAAHKAAGTHATTADVKMHAKHMLTDHEKMGKDMKDLAAKKNLTLSTDAPADKKQMLDDMNANKKGKDWDMAYIDAQIVDHNEAIALFKQGSASVKDADLKALIDATIPKLEEHLKMVQDAKTKMAM